MFEINRQPLIAEIRCRECRASIEINTDQQRLIERSVAEFARRHRCRLARAITKALNPEVQ